MLTLRCVFWLVAAAAILFYGWYAVTVLLEEGERKERKEEDKKEYNKKPTVWRDDPKHRHWSWWLHQTWVNTLCSFLGWLTVDYLIFSRHIFSNISSITVSDGFFILFGLVGICGFLPWRLFNAGIK
jgi:hypothetical protein